METFKISREQIQSLNNLGLKWDCNIEQENVDVPTKYETEEGIKLGKWLRTQRQSYEGNGTNKITENPNQYVENIADSNHKQKKLGTR